MEATTVIRHLPAMESWVVQGCWITSPQNQPLRTSPSEPGRWAEKIAAPSDTNGVEGVILEIHSRRAETSVRGPHRPRYSEWQTCLRPKNSTHLPRRLPLIDQHSVPYDICRSPTDGQGNRVNKSTNERPGATSKGLTKMYYRPNDPNGLGYHISQMCLKVVGESCV